MQRNQVKKSRRKAGEILERPPFEGIALLLQGGGALGAYHDGEFTTAEDVAQAVLLFAAFGSNALTGQSLIVSHGWGMQ
jgi:hypothetical protein